MKPQKISLFLLFLSLAIVAITFWTCEKEGLNPTDTTWTKEIVYKAKKCPKLDFDVRGTGTSKKEAKADLENRAALTCYTLCLNSKCEDGGCAYSKVSLSGKKTTEDADGNIEINAKGKCTCDCEDCKGKKGIAKTFTALGFEGESEADVTSKANALARNHCKTVECPRYPCKETEVCLFEEDGTVTEVLSSKVNNGIWTVVVSLIECDCDCGDPPLDGEN